jgi:hypothetical protein
MLLLQKHLVAISCFVPVGTGVGWFVGAAAVSQADNNNRSVSKSTVNLFRLLRNVLRTTVPEPELWLTPQRGSRSIAVYTLKPKRADLTMESVILLVEVPLMLLFEVLLLRQSQCYRCVLCL